MQRKKYFVCLFLKQILETDGIMDSLICWSDTLSLNMYIPIFFCYWESLGKTLLCSVVPDFQGISKVCLQILFT